MPGPPSYPSATSSSYLVLPSPTACNFGDPPNVDEDDSYCAINLPFPMRLYSQSSTTTFASVNGYISLLTGSVQYQAQPFPDVNLPNNTFAPFFDDLYISGAQTPMQGIFYQIQGTAVTYEYYVSRAGTQGSIYHFTVTYDSANAGVFLVHYYATGSASDPHANGAAASVGMQGSKYQDLAAETVVDEFANAWTVSADGTEMATSFSYRTTNITPGTLLSCDSNSNVCTQAQS